MAQSYRSHKNNFESNDHHIFELFLFVNPIGNHCLNCEKEVMNFVKNTDKKVYIRFVACNNFQVFNESLKHRENRPNSLRERNQMYYSAREIAMAFKAALLQGRKIGRSLLMQLQEHFGQNQHPFSREEMIRIATNNKGVDIDVWLEDIDSPLTVDSFKMDQQLSKQMKIKTTPTLVIFDNSNYSYGLKLEHDINQKTIAEIISQMEAESDRLNHQKKQKSCLHILPARFEES
ncbi:DsbA family protein [Aerococcus kribbianus]|uniref:DsbA family protein n=1 Tax=Aerococcus kribbianus TaxID=2999064 RepID=A0A9X3FPT3_9LACT|nr:MULTISPECIES: DsbA family protein [unclassified Aerococcus]MCZ0717743.1 DsbA family protein [Aerococcus sp. YH-aer221]MCZ0726031.1 DsbA family protein [Aerococcus sp. YH-aer222]